MTPSEAMTVPRLAAANLSKWYGHVAALRDVSVDFLPGLTGIVGDNGAGKSTLMKVLSGVEVPDEGWISSMANPRPSTPLWMRALLALSLCTRTWLWSTQCR